MGLDIATEREDRAEPLGSDHEPLGSMDMKRVLDDTRRRMRAAHIDHLGYPYNLVGTAPTPDALSGFLINNLGDPYVGSHYGSEVCALERETVAWLMDLWGCDDHDDVWGSVVASGTEGNFWALYLAREALPTGRLIYSRDAHYSIPKAARILRMDAVEVPSDPTGAIDIAAVTEALRACAERPVVLALTCGTTVKGAHDDLAAAMAALDHAGIGADRRYVHVDGALNAMVVPFLGDAPTSIQPSFRHGIDSVSTSGHKMIGTPMPCGVLVARRRHVERIASAVAYLRSDDTTFMGSRNGHAVLALWARLHGHGFEGYQADAADALRSAEQLTSELRAAGVPVLHNPWSLTVVFPQPSECIVARYQLACNAGEAHAILMPSVTGALRDRFAHEYLTWWGQRAQR